MSAQLIICADTNPYFRGFVTRFLTDSGYEVAATGTASEIVVTVFELSPEEKIKYHSLGASSFLLTPVGYSEILRVVNPPAADARKTSAA